MHVTSDPRGVIGFYLSEVPYPNFARLLLFFYLPANVCDAAQRLFCGYTPSRLPSCMFTLRIVFRRSLTPL
jgi:hypothetical protein